MNLELNAEQAQTVITYQTGELGKRTRRLRRAHVHTKYLQSTRIKIPRIAIQSTINHLNWLIGSDQPNDHDGDFCYQYDHEELEKIADKFRAILEKDTYDPVTLPLFTYECLFVLSGYDDVSARNTLYSFEHLQGELRLPSEPDTPNFFSYSKLFFV